MANTSVRQHDSQMSILSLHTLAVPPPGPQAVSQRQRCIRAPFPFLSPSHPSFSLPFPFRSQFPSPLLRLAHYRATACCGGGIRHACCSLMHSLGPALPYVAFQFHACLPACLPALRSSLARPLAPLKAAPPAHARLRPRPHTTGTHTHPPSASTRRSRPSSPPPRRTPAVRASLSLSLLPLPPSLPLFFSALSAFLTFSSFPPLLLFYTLPPSSLSPLIILVCDNTCNGLG